MYMALLFVMVTMVGPLNATIRPSVEGRALVAEEGEFPPGLYAKSAGFLPGDSVLVTNPATGVSINVMILGTLETQGGTAILLSPEAAVRLFITKNSNSLVSVTKRSSSVDLAAGIRRRQIDPDKYPEDAIPSELEEKIKEAKVSEGKPVSPTQLPYSPLETSRPEANVPLDTPPPTHPFTLAADDEPRQRETNRPSETSPELLGVEMRETPSEIFSPAVPVTPKEKSAMPAVPVEPWEKAESAPYENYKSLAINDYNPVTNFGEEEYPEVARTTYPPLAGTDSIWSPRTDVPYNGPEVIVSPESNTGYVPQVLQRFDGYSGEVPQVIANQNSLDVPLTEIIPSPDFNPGESLAVQQVDDINIGTLSDRSVLQVDVRESDVLEIAVVDETVPDALEIAVVDEAVPAASSLRITEPAPDLVERVVLIPAEPQKPPVLQENTPDNTFVEDAIVLVWPEKKPEILPLGSKFADLMVDPATLKPGAYYVQLTTTADLRSIDKLLTKYGGKYPFALVPARTPDFFQVLVGPLTMDEYGVVLARFQGSGYRDAFLRKIR
jgi:hypothetical protein